MKYGPKIAICLPSGASSDSNFMMCLVNLQTHLLTRSALGLGQLSFLFLNKRTSLLPKSRQEMLRDAIAAQCDYALFIDTDQTFPSNLLYGLLRHRKDVVACNIVTKSVPASPTARSFNPNYKGGDVVFTDPHSKGLEKVWRVGTGIMLIKLEILKKIPKPWFLVTYDIEEDEFTGEDWFFCGVLEKAGIEIFIDHDLSKHVGHMGTLEYTHNLVGEIVREEVAKQKEATA